jgi:transglutaminase-like putative cysteine protease
MTMRRTRFFCRILAVVIVTGPGGLSERRVPAQDELPTRETAIETEPSQSRSDGGGNTGYTLLVAPARQVRAELTVKLEAPGLNAREWVVYGAQLPVLPCQTGVSSTMVPEGESGRELSPEHRPIVRSRIRAESPEQEKNLEVRLEYQATLWSRRLVRSPLRAGSRARGVEAVSVPPLDEGERRAALAAGGLFDLTSEAFRRWRDEEEMHRGPKEGEIDFARRVFLAIKRGFTYAFEDRLDRHASRVCRGRASDCGGLSVLFASALRAEKIPARLLVGRWAKSAERDRGNYYGQWHIKAEFYAQGVGWVPVDPACGVLHDRSPEGLAFFGNDPGDFLVLHVDPDLICDTISWGRQTVLWLQTPARWAVGTGIFVQAVDRETWEVRSGRPPELVEAALKKAVAPPAKAKPKRGRPKSRSPR